MKASDTAERWGMFELAVDGPAGLPDVAAFTESHGLSGLANWHFLCGEAALTQGLMTEYGASVDVPAVGMIAHSEDVFFVTPDGHERAYLDDGAGEQLTGTYADAVERELRLLAR